MTNDNLIPNDPRFHSRMKTRRQAGEQLKELLERERNELEDEFVADNIVMLVQRAQHDVLHGTGSVQMCEDTDLVADAVAEQMRGINGPGWKYSTDDVIELIDEESGVFDKETV